MHATILRNIIQEHDNGERETTFICSCNGLVQDNDIPVTPNFLTGIR